MLFARCLPSLLDQRLFRTKSDIFHWLSVHESSANRRIEEETLTEVQPGLMHLASNLSQGGTMQTLHSGQCGLCNHFGEHHAKNNILVSILSTMKAEPTVLDECGHPKHASLHLKVTPISGCDGFTPAAQA